MLFGKINPAASISVQETPYQSITVNANWITAVARNYVMGAESSNFLVYFGNLSMPTGEEATQGYSEVPVFMNFYTTQVVLTAQQLSTWGTNDETLLNIIAATFNATISVFVDVPEITSL